MTSEPAPKLSVFIATFNRAKLLDRCLRSVCQTTVNCEILIGDDGSTDDTPDVVSSYAQRDSRVKYLRSEQNLGANANILRTFQACRGEYVNFLGDDDYVSPGNFEKKVAILDAFPDVGMVYSRWNTVDDDGNVLPADASTNFSYIGGRDEFRDLLVRFHGNTPSLMVRRQLWLPQGYPAGEPAEGDPWPPGRDVDMWLETTRKTRTAFINEPLVTCGVQRVRETTRHVDAGKLAGAKTYLLRQLLVERADAPILADSTWASMRLAFAQDLEHWLSPQQSPADYLREFDRIHQDYVAKVSQRTADQLRRTGCSIPTSTSGLREAGVVWSGALRGEGDYGRDMRSLATLADDAAVLLRLEDAGWQASGSAQVPLSERLNELAWTSVRNGQYVRVWHKPACYFEEDHEAAATVGRPLVETDGLPQECVDRSNALDLLWVPDEFSRGVFERAGVPAAKVRVLPTAIDLNAYQSVQTAAQLDPGSRFHFLAVHPWQISAGWDVLVQAYAKAFHPDDDVSLLFIVQPSPGAPAALQQIQADIQRVLSAGAGSSNWRVAPISVQIGSLADISLPDVFRSAHAYVEASRANRYAAELIGAMAAGVPTIATSWGGHLDLLAEDSALLVQAREVDVPPGGLGTLPTEGLRWAEPDVDHLAALLRKAVAQKETVQALAERAAAKAVSYSSAAVERQLVELYEEASEVRSAR